MRIVMTAIALVASVTFVSSAPSHAQPGSCPKPRTDYRQLASAAYIWGYPLIRSAQLRQNMTLPEDPMRARPSTTAGAPLNRLGHARELATPETRQGVAPNNDTLYSLAWLDTDTGPFVFESPDFGGRYYTFQFGQADTSTDIALGQSTHESRMPPVFIQGPSQNYRVPPGMLTVRSSQRYLMIAGRTLVTGQPDLAAAYRLQDAMKLRRWSDYRANIAQPAPITPQRMIERKDPPANDPTSFLTMLGVVLADWRSTPSERAFVRSLAPLGLGEGRPFDPMCLSAPQLSEVRQGLEEGRKAIELRTRALGVSVNGWTINYRGAQFGQDHLLRAAVAMDQIYVLPASEALYMNAKFSADGQVLDGRKSYILRFAADALPTARHFWSATMYFAKGFLVPNEINRYSIGDRTPGLTRRADGSIEILLQRDRPENLGGANWLPSPAEPFSVMLRLYGPEKAALERKWSPPAIVEVAPR